MTTTVPDNNYVHLDPQDRKRIRTISVVSCSASEKAHYEQRGVWEKEHDFTFAILGATVGLGALWRFPYLVYKHGGGAFIIIFLISMAVLGIPFFFLELLMGQYLGLSQVCVFGQMAPIFKGIGYSILAVVFFFCTYYAVILGWAIYYFVASFTAIPSLPWDGCHHEWNTDRCFDALNPNQSIHTLQEHGVTLNQSVPSVEEFWNIHVLGITGGIEDVGSIQWPLVGCLLGSWLLIYFIVWKGLHSSGKVIWFTAIFPYVILLTLFIRAVTLEGASDGLWFYVNPVWEKMMNPQAWVDGGTQVAFAYSVGTGALFAVGSYNRFNHRLYRPVLLVGLLSPVTALFAGTVTFSILGYLANQTQKSVEEVIAQGPGLTFIAYPQCVSLMAGAPFWAIIFFFMMMLIGINSQFASLEGLILAVVDDWPQYLSLPGPRFKFNLGCCMTLFALGLPMVTGGGPYIFQLIDSFGVSGLPVLWAMTFEVVCMSWVWGADKIYRAMEEMTGYKLSIFWKICWKYVCPFYMIGLFIFSIVKYEPVKYGDSYVYPWWGQMLAWLIGCTVMVWIPFYAVYFLVNAEGTFKERIRKGLTPKLRRRPDAQSNSVPLSIISSHKEEVSTITK